MGGYINYGLVVMVTLLSWSMFSKRSRFESCMAKCYADWRYLRVELIIEKIRDYRYRLVIS